MLQTTECVMRSLDVVSIIFHPYSAARVRLRGLLLPSALTAALWYVLLALLWAVPFLARLWVEREALRHSDVERRAEHRKGGESDSAAACHS